MFRIRFLSLLAALLCAAPLALPTLAAEVDCDSIYCFTPEDFGDSLTGICITGLPDARLGEIAAAIIEIKEGLTCTEEEIDEFCQALPRYKRPRKIFFDKVPRNPTGKIEKPKLRKIYCGESLVAAQNRG